MYDKCGNITIPIELESFNKLAQAYSIEGAKRYVVEGRWDRNAKLCKAVIAPSPTASPGATTPSPTPTPGRARPSPTATPVEATPSPTAAPEDGTIWTSDSAVICSGSGDLLDVWAICEAIGGGTLTFDTSYDFEVEFDYGFVQVSKDGGATWTSLGNEYTTSIYDIWADPNIIAELPGLTDYSDWVTMSFDLSGYGGGILIGFRYMTDESYFLDGWCIDNIYVDSTLISDGSSMTPFMTLEEVLGS
jgi:hypothetical protein